MKTWPGALLCLLIGCASDPEPVSRTSTAGSGGVITAGRGASGLAQASCTVGSSPCFCPDGQLSGTQTCDARRQLSACQCAVAASGAERGAESSAKAVCPELANSATCSAQTYVSPQLPASVLFVVDRSGSMACNAPPVQTVESCSLDPKRLVAAQPSRWEITTGALDATFASLVGSAAAVGISMFSVDGYCGVDSTPTVGVGPVDMTQLTALSTAMRVAEPAGGTPIVGGMISAYHHLHEELHAMGNRYVVLITDGEESCGTAGDAANTADLLAARTRLLDTEVTNARLANIKTFVVGTPGSEAARGFLSELAFRGGTARSATCTHGNSTGGVGDCHYDLTTERDFATVLQTTLGRISSEARGCEFQTPSGGMLNVQLSVQGGAPVCLPMDERDCATAADGFQYVKRADGVVDYSRVVLCGPACEKVKSDPSAVVDVILGCAVLL